MFVDEHPLVLNLDIDQVRCLLGGWRDRFRQAGELVRPIALAMAATHLRSGQDVVMPQYLGRLGEIERFATVAHDTAADFIELVMLDSKERSIERFYGRGASDGLAWHDEVRSLVERCGGRAALDEMYDRLEEVLEHRPNSRVVSSRAGDIHESYEEFCRALGE
jgi:hypothetical protein